MGVLVVGPPGTGKTILGNQFCFNHVAAGHRAVGGVECRQVALDALFELLLALVDLAGREAELGEAGLQGHDVVTLDEVLGQVTQHAVTERPARTVEDGIRGASDDAVDDEPATLLEGLARLLDTLVKDGLADAEADELERYGNLQTQYQLREGYAAESRVEAALDRLGLGGLDRRRTLGSLSGGEQERVALAWTDALTLLADGARGLRGQRLHSGERVLHAMMQLPQQQTLQSLGGLDVPYRGDHDQSAGDTMRA